MEQGKNLSRDMEKAYCKCMVHWCNGKQTVSGRGYCRKHYDQIRAHGFISDERSRRDPSRVYVCDDIAYIMVTDGKDETLLLTAVIDADDAERVSKHRWTVNTNGYIRTYEGHTPVYLHRFVMNYSGDLDVDHINRDKRDNRKSNLRIVEHYVNTCNVACNPRLVRSATRPFEAKFNFNKERHYLGCFEKEEDARTAILNAKKELGVFV